MGVGKSSFQIRLCISFSGSKNIINTFVLPFILLTIKPLVIVIQNKEALSSFSSFSKSL